jgi:hypothetical protein
MGPWTTARRAAAQARRLPDTGVEASAEVSKPPKNTLFPLPLGAGDPRM